MELLCVRMEFALFMLEKGQADTQGNIPRKVRVYFYRDKIYYWFNKCLHKADTWADC